MPTPPTLVAYSQANALVATGAAVTTASLSWQTDDVVVVFVATEGGTSGETIATPTTTGAGISFGAAQQIHNSTGSDCGGACYAAVATANSSGTFSEAATHSVSDRQKLIAVFIFRGSGGIGNSAITPSFPSTARTVALTPTGADGAVAWCVFDWAAVATAAFTPTPTSHDSTHPGPTALPDSALISLKFTYYLGDVDDQASAGSVDYGIGGAGTGPFTIIAFEAKASAAPPPPPAPTTYAMLRPPVVAP